ncbi:hypothetical protein BST14_02630 [Mycobacterium arosiense ATCC BAA-1401 = DSM 45069]|uniref:Uncharacterized protein n=1 Tax=Mycobacterium arosiense ATCC BAA-1401 = DSM 45069 TaxID=1265311 RepID=A0A1W9ZQU9_MYCAI|nr:hypothetical protein BST14_02630 [Mycobacterium arosiense ATCC BAA-1401 = DSM 45069]
MRQYVAEVDGEVYSSVLVVINEHEIHDAARWMTDDIETVRKDGFVVHGFLTGLAGPQLIPSCPRP